MDLSHLKRDQGKGDHGIHKLLRSSSPDPLILLCSQWRVHAGDMPVPAGMARTPPVSQEG